MPVLGLDVGGSGIKGAVVDTSTGSLLSERLRYETPNPAEPEAVLETIQALIAQFGWKGEIGCGFPAVIDRGYARSAANISDLWIDFDVVSALDDATGCRCAVINDADAAGLAEMRLGAGRDCLETVLVLTLGTGIGSALFHQGRLFPNLELGTLPFKGSVIERYAAASVRKEKKLSWEKWAGRLNRFLAIAENLVCPERIIIGGGVSRKHEKYFHLLEARASVHPAEFYNRAGLIGAACYAAEVLPSSS